MRSRNVRPRTTARARLRYTLTSREASTAPSKVPPSERLRRLRRRSNRRAGSFHRKVHSGSPDWPLWEFVCTTQNATLPSRAAARGVTCRPRASFQPLHAWHAGRTGFLGGDGSSGIATAERHVRAKRRSREPSMIADGQNGQLPPGRARTARLERHVDRLIDDLMGALPHPDRLSAEERLGIIARYTAVLEGNFIYWMTAAHLAVASDTARAIVEDNLREEVRD